MQKRDLLKQVLKLGVMPIVLLLFFSCTDDNIFDDLTGEVSKIYEAPFEIFTDIEYTEMIYVKGGSFEMGATNGIENSNEGSAHKVTLNGYHISKYEVTQKLWQRVMDDNPSSIKGENLPVNNVSWNDCQEFIKRLNALTGKKYALPTEAEWEYAARGGAKSLNYKYSGSNTIDDVAYFNTSNYDNVGTKQPNELGLYDMSGNVAEWCYDGYAPYSDQEQNNPCGVIEAENRVVRGGCWNSSEDECSVSFRDGSMNSDDNSENIGLRLVLSKPYYEVSVDAEIGGEAELNNGKKTLYVREGEQVTLKAIANDYDFVSWVLNKNDVSKKAEYSPVITSDAKYVANFGYCKITLTDSPEGVKPTGKAGDIQKHAAIEININTRTIPSGYKFAYWLANGKFLSTTQKLTLNISESTEFTPYCVKIEKEGNYECVDLGLSVKWASYNVGASKQTQSGNYYPWAETSATNQKYNLSTYKWWDSETNSFTKYCTDPAYGIVDNKVVLEEDDDIASKLWKGNWRTPTTEEWEELKNECEWTWVTDMNGEIGVNGYLIMNKNNDNYIFLRAAGYNYNSTIHFLGEGGYYWTKELSLNNSSYAGYFHFYKDTRIMGYHERYTGHPIRAVVEKE